jgi:hypothetical protein
MPIGLGSSISSLRTATISESAYVPTRSFNFDGSDDYINLGNSWGLKQRATDTSEGEGISVGVWFKLDNTITNASAGIQYRTGSITPQIITPYDQAPSDEHVTNITNLKPAYSTSETARFRVYIREKDWCPTVYNVSSRDAENKLIESGSYKVFRIIDELDVIPYGTGSDLHTAMSYDVSGNYFDLDMSMLEADYMYGIRFAYYNNSIGSYVEQPEVFKFRVEK